MKNSLFIKLILLIQLYFYNVVYFFVPRYKKMKIFFLGRFIDVPDFASFYSMYKEIFINEIYCFSRDNDAKNLIVDAGANIGLSVIYFKLKYLNSRIIAIEADSEIFKILVKNLNAFGFKMDTVLINKALWSKGNVKLKFYSEGADGGRVDKEIEKIKPIIVDTVTFADIVGKNKIDFLKVDIEGAEYEALRNQKMILSNTNNAFVEYHSFIDSKQNLSDLLRIFRDVGFRLNIIDTMGNRKAPLINKLDSLGMDLRLNIFLTRY